VFAIADFPDNVSAAALSLAANAAGAVQVKATVLISPEEMDQAARIVDLAARTRLPVIYTNQDFMRAGGLMSYAADTAELHRHTATYVDKILKGAKAAELPVEQPTKFELAINLKAAKQIGLTIPRSVLYRADKVIK
jgi:putative ABC transport system substrate-binding protein